MRINLDISNSIPHLFQILLSSSIVPYTMYFILLYWVYPMNHYLGDTVCYALDYSRLIAFYAIQLQSFFHSLFRYICLFHQKFLFKLNLGAHVCIFRQCNISGQIFVLFIYFYSSPFFSSLSHFIQLSCFKILVDRKVRPELVYL